MYSSASEFYSHSIDQSLRFVDGDSAYLTRTNSSAGNRRTWTFSAWVKRGDLDSSQNYILGGTTDNYNLNWAVFFFGSDELTFYSYTNSENYQLHTSGVFRDPSAWYHLVLAWDTTQSTAADRIILYVNGSRQALDTYNEPSLNYEEAYVNNNIQQDLGKAATAAKGYDGYMAEVHFVDGTALAPTSFGETKAGIWIPKAYTGSHGTNGYYLDFADGSALGDDESGNGNDFTPNGVAATDVVLDSPTNNWCTYNSILNTSMVLSEGNLAATNSTSAWNTTSGTFSVSSGKWYWEVLHTGGSYNMVGIIPTTFSSFAAFAGSTSDSYSWYTVGNKYTNGTSATYGGSWTVGDIIGVALDLDAGTLTYYKNGVSKGAAFTGISGTYAPAESLYASNAVTNFGQDSSFANNKTAQGNTDGNGKGDFYYSPPSGFLALCTANLPDPAIDPAQDEEPADYFNTVLYTGNNSTQSITGVGFQPDWLWLKNRTTGNSHALFDSVRGSGSNGFYNLSTNTTNTELDATNVTSLDSDGFTLGSNAGTNGNTNSLVSWNWLAGGSAVSNSDGSITSSVSANTEAGFSIVSYTGTGATSQQTIGVGLSWSGKDKLVIIKNRDDNTYNWGVNSNLLASNKVLSLNTTNNDSQENSSHYITYETFGFRTYNGSNILNLSDNYIAYCFHSVDGYSRVGKYTGNGSSDGPFVYTGFRPAFLLIKITSGTTASWYIYDSARNTFNETNFFLRPDLSNAELTGTPIDILSNGFKIRSSSSGVNYSAANYIYLAFAEQPFKYSNAR